MREGKANNLLAALASDERIPLDEAELKALIGNPIDFTGDAREQVSRVVARIETIAKKFPTAATYKPGSIR
jgi:adenylosuccinate lyase